MSMLATWRFEKYYNAILCLINGCDITVDTMQEARPSNAYHDTDHNLYEGK